MSDTSVGVELRPARHRAWLRLLPLAAVLAAGACSHAPRSGGYYQDDGPETRPPADVLNTPDATPRDEPLAASGNRPYTVFGVSYTPMSDARGYRERGVASWYGKKFHGRRTSSGEPYDMYAMTAAHRTLPLPSYVRVRNLQNGRSVVVRVNDRGPFLHNRLIDLSYTAAAKLGMLGAGTALVEVESVTNGAPPATTAAATRLAPIAAAEAKSDAPARLSVQVGAFHRYENATALRDRLARAGVGDVFIEPGTPPAIGTPVTYRVRIGPVASVAEGDRLVALAARHGIADALLVVE